MNVVDSSGWLEYFADASNADFIAAPIENTEALIVPSLSLFEVFKRVLMQRGEDAALQAVAQMQQGHVVALDAALAMSAARLSLALKLPMANSIMLTTARHHGAELWTQDADFKPLQGVGYKEKKTAG